jgi:hypothetical protein
MLLLIGYEYRVDGPNSDSIATHIHGVQTLMKICKERNIVLVDEVQRALFWQDLFSCLMAGTPRLLSHSDFQEFRCARDVERLEQRDTPSGFMPHVPKWPGQFIAAMQDLNALCGLVDATCGLEDEPLDVFPIDNDQGNLESRFVDLLSTSRRFPNYTHPIYEAGIFAGYMCTYKLSAGIWQGCYIPEVCASQIIRCVTEVAHDVHWEVAPEMLFWLLFVSGGLTERKYARAKVIILIQRVLRNYLWEFMRDWDTSRSILQRFIFSTRAMDRKLFGFWEELHTNRKCQSKGEQRTVQLR